MRPPVWLPSISASHREHIFKTSTFSWQQKRDSGGKSSFARGVWLDVACCGVSQPEEGAEMKWKPCPRSWESIWYWEGRAGLCCITLCRQPGMRGISDVCLSKEGSDPGCSKPATNQICKSTLASFSRSAPLAPFGLLPKCFHGLDSSGCFP